MSAKVLTEGSTIENVNKENGIAVQPVGIKINGDPATFLQKKYFNIGAVNRLVNFRSIKRLYTKLFIGELAEECHYPRDYLSKVKKKIVPGMFQCEQALPDK